MFSVVQSHGHTSELQHFCVVAALAVEGMDVISWI